MRHVGIGQGWRADDLLQSFWRLSSRSISDKQPLYSLHLHGQAAPYDAGPVEQPYSDLCDFSRRFVVLQREVHPLAYRGIH